jgi:hypothetical protein
VGALCENEHAQAKTLEMHPDLVCRIFSGARANFFLSKGHARRNNPPDRIIL